MLFQVVFEGIFLGKRPPTVVTLERMDSAVDPPVDNKITHARVRLGAGLTGDADLGVNGPAVLLQGPAVHERLRTVRTLVRAFRGVPAPVDDQVAHGAEILTANLALKQEVNGFGRCRQTLGL